MCQPSTPSSPLSPSNPDHRFTSDVSLSFSGPSDSRGSTLCSKIDSLEIERNSNNPIMQIFAAIRRSSFAFEFDDLSFSDPADVSIFLSLPVPPREARFEDWSSRKVAKLENFDYPSVNSGNLNENFPDFLDFQNFRNFQNAPEIPTFPKFGNLSIFPIQQNVEDIAISQSVSNSPKKTKSENVSNSQNFQISHVSPKTQNFPKLQNLQISKIFSETQNLLDFQMIPKNSNVPYSLQSPTTQKIVKFESFPKSQNFSKSQDFLKSQNFPESQNFPKTPTFPKSQNLDFRKSTTLQDLPGEILSLFFENLRELKDRNSASLVCKLWLRADSMSRQKLKIQINNRKIFTDTGAKSGAENGTENITANRKKNGTTTGLPEFLEEKGRGDIILEKMVKRFCNLKEIEIVNLGVPKEATFTDVGLSQIGSSLPNLEKFRLRNSSGVTSRGISKMLKSCGQSLTEIDFFGCPGIREKETFLSISKHCPKLKILVLKASGLVDDESLKDLFSGSRFPKTLERLEFEFCLTATENGIQNFPQTFPFLKILNLSHSEITDFSFSEISRKCQKMEQFHARACSQLTDISLKKLAQNCHFLKMIDLRRVRQISTSGILYLLENCQKLEKIWMEESMVNEIIRKLAFEKGVQLVVFSRVV